MKTSMIAVTIGLLLGAQAAQAQHDQKDQRNQPGQHGPQARPGGPGGGGNRPGKPDRPPPPGGGVPGHGHRPGQDHKPAPGPKPGQGQGPGWQRPHRPFKPVHGPAYRWPHRQTYRRWTTGSFLPMVFLSPAYYYDNWSYFGVGAPPPGYRWVRYGPDLLLVNLRTRRVADVVYGAFD